MSCHHHETWMLQDNNISVEPLKGLHNSNLTHGILIQIKSYSQLIAQQRRLVSAHALLTDSNR